MIEVIDKYLYSKNWLHTIPKIYILDNLENDLQYIFDYLCCSMLSTKLSTLDLLTRRKDNLVDDENDDD